VRQTTRQILRESVRVQCRGRRVGNALQARWRHLVFFLGGILLVVALGTGGLVLYQGYRENQGLEILQEGIQLLQAGQAGEAIARLERAGRMLPRGEARLLALFFLGQALQQRGETEREIYEALAKEAGEEHYLKQFVLVHLGCKAEQQQELSRAQQFYEQAAAMGGPMQTLALLAQARVWQRLGRDEAAQEVYAKFLVDHPDSLLVDIVQQQKVE
jgi:tetratricopeptide (TPR) repeat protein